MRVSLRTAVTAAGLLALCGALALFASRRPAARPSPTGPAGADAAAALREQLSSALQRGQGLEARVEAQDRELRSLRDLLEGQQQHRPSDDDEAHEQPVAGVPAHNGAVADAQALRDSPCLSHTAEELAAMWQRAGRVPLDRLKRRPSRLSLCQTLHAHHGIAAHALEDELQSERQYLSTEFRLFQRDLALDAIGPSRCVRGFGGDARFLASGNYGYTLAKCIAKECAQPGRTIIKLVTLDGADITSAVAPNEHSASLESAVLAILRDEIVSTGMLPHIVVGYSAWLCDNALEGDLLHSEAECDAFRKSMTGRKVHPIYTEDAAIAYMRRDCDLRKELHSRRKSSSLLIIAQEEADASLREAAELIAHNYPMPHQVEIWRGLLFQLTVTFAVLQKRFDGWRHNDLSWNNVRVTLPDHLAVTRRDADNKTYSVWGSMKAPRTSEQDPTPTTAFSYVFDQTAYFVPNYGFSVRLLDFDFATSADPRMQNTKISERESLKCAVPLEQPAVWDCGRAVALDMQTDDKAVIEVELQAAARRGSVAVQLKDNGVIRNGIFSATAEPTARGPIRLTLVRSPGADRTVARTASRDESRRLSGEICVAKRSIVVDSVTVTGDGREQRIHLSIDEDTDVLGPAPQRHGLVALVGFADLRDGEYRIADVQESKLVVEGNRYSKDLPYPGSYSGGVAVVVGQPSRADFFVFHAFGIVPVPNRKYDLHYLFVCLQNEAAHKHQAWFPEKVYQFLTDSMPASSREFKGDITYGFRLTDSMGGWYCAKTGAMSEHDRRLDKIPLPSQLLGHEWFRAFLTQQVQQRVLEVYKGDP